MHRRMNYHQIKILLTCLIIATPGLGAGICHSQTTNAAVTVTPNPEVIGHPIQGMAYERAADFEIHGTEFDIVLVQMNVAFSGAGDFSILVKENDAETIFQTCMMATEPLETQVEIVLRDDFCCFAETPYQLYCNFQSESGAAVTIGSVTVQAYMQTSSGLYPIFPKIVRPYMLGPWGKTRVRLGNDLARSQPSKTNDPESQTVECHVITLGALLDLSGPLSTVGKACLGVLETAMEDFNSSFQDAQYDRPIFEAQCIVNDTQSDPQTALEKLQALHERGVRFVIGPISSGEAEALRTYANENDMLLISPSSTAPALAIAGDNLFRFTVDDTHQGKIAAEFMSHLGIENVVSVFRNDAYGQALSETVRPRFEERGGTIEDAIPYDPTIADFTSLASDLNAAIETALQTVDPSHLAVHVAAYGEIADILELASSYPALSMVRWFGCDAQPQEKKILDNPLAAAFAYSTCFTAPIFGGVVNSSQECRRIAAIAETKSQTAISTAALTVYDVFAVVLKAIQQANLATSTNSIRNEVESIARHYYGITGAAALNEAGDRNVGNFDFWNVGKNADETYDWTKTGILIETDGTFPDIIYYQGCPCTSASVVSRPNMY